MGRYCELMTKLIDKGVGDEVWTIRDSTGATLRLWTW